MPDHLVLYTAQFKKSTDFSKFIDKIRNFLANFPVPTENSLLLTLKNYSVTAIRKNDLADLVHIK